MAETTYTLPLNDPERVAQAMSAIFLHLIVWKQTYGIDFISCVRLNGPARIEVKFSDPVPQDERQHIRLSVS